MLQHTGRNLDPVSLNASIQAITQNFDIMRPDPAAFKKVMESLRTDFEALEKMQSDKRRTAHAQ